MLFGMLFGVLVNMALAGDCDQSSTPAELTHTVNEAIQIWKDGNRILFIAAKQNAEKSFECLNRPLQRRDAGSYHLMHALYQARVSSSWERVLPYVVAWGPTEEDEELELFVDLIGGPQTREEKKSYIHESIQSFEDSNSRTFPPPARGLLRLDGDLARRIPDNTPYTFQRITRQGDVIPGTTTYFHPGVGDTLLSEVPRYPRLRNRLMTVALLTSASSSSLLVGAYLTRHNFQSSREPMRRKRLNNAFLSASAGLGVVSLASLGTIVISYRI